MEGRQLVLKLTTNKALLDELRKKKAFIKDTEGEIFTRQFNSQTFDFRPGSHITVDVNVGRALIRDSQFIVGDPLTGEVISALEVVKEFNVGTGEGHSCNHCGASFDNPRQLGRHLMRDCTVVRDLMSGSEEDAVEESNADASEVVPERA